jgi:hypothetical protein
VTPPDVAPAARAAGAAVAATGAAHRATISDKRDKKNRSLTLRMMLSSVSCIPGGRSIVTVSRWRAQHEIFFPAVGRYKANLSDEYTLYRQDIQNNSES